MKKKTVKTLLISLAAAVLMAALAYIVCFIVKNVNDVLTTPTVTTVPEGTTEPSTQGTSVPTTTEAPTVETTVAPTVEPTTVPPTTVPPTEPPTTEAPTAPPTTEPEETWIPTEPPETDPPVTEPKPTEPKPTEPKPTEPEVKFEEVSETVYTSNNATIHTGPGFTYKAVKALDKGTELLRTGIGENGWSRVVYNGKTYYIYTQKLTKSKPADEPKPTEPPVEPTSPNYAGDGKYYCHACGKICGDGRNGTCVLSLMGDFKCGHCGMYVPAMTCHTCEEDN